MEQVIIQFLVGLVSKYPIITSIIMVVGILRAVNKPLMTFLHAVVLATPTNKDDELLGKVEGSKIYGIVSFVLDYIASIKLPK